MDPWVFSDGTKVYLGGKVSGESFFSSSLRTAFSFHRSGRDRLVTSFGTPPDCEVLDLDVPHLLDSWLRGTYPSPIELVSSPKFETPSIDPGPEPSEQRIY